jgi:hypothetical protein
MKPVAPVMSTRIKNPFLTPAGVDLAVGLGIVQQSTAHTSGRGPNAPNASRG